ncbi:MAG: 50S ribosomal protein L10, partial [Halobacteriales archaeon]|nr:50S ribosomal protein L10 [Halobacteriales archaeon]
MKRSAKEAFVTDFRERLERAPVMYLTDFTGLDVKSMTVLRQKLKENGAEYLVAKNRLVGLALADTDMPDLSSALMGPTGIVFGYEDAVGPAKALTEFAKEHDDRPVFKLGVLEN